MPCTSIGSDGARRSRRRSCFGVNVLCAGILASSLIMGCGTRGLSDQVRQDIAAQVENQRGTLVDCYRQALERDPELAGRLTLRFVVAERSGEVRDVAIAQANVQDQELRQCVVACAARLKVRHAPSKPVMVTYPVVFEPAVGE